MAKECLNAGGAKRMKTNHRASRFLGCMTSPHLNGGLEYSMVGLLIYLAGYKSSKARLQGMVP